METLIAHTSNEKQALALKAVFEAMEIEYEIEDSEDETERILKSPVNTKHLNESIKQLEEGKLTAIKIEDLWK